MEYNFSVISYFRRSRLLLKVQFSTYLYNFFISHTQLQFSTHQLVVQHWHWISGSQHLTDIHHIHRGCCTEISLCFRLPEPIYDPTGMSKLLNSCRHQISNTVHSARDASKPFADEETHKSTDLNFNRFQ